MSKKIEELSDRELAERSYYASKMLFIEIQRLKERVTYNSSDSKTRSVFDSMRMAMKDPGQAFEETLDEYITSESTKG
jgi:ribosomal protein L11 methylase PrmA